MKNLFFLFGYFIFGFRDWDSLDFGQFLVHKIRLLLVTRNTPPRCVKDRPTVGVRQGSQDPLCHGFPGLCPVGTGPRVGQVRETPNLFVTVSGRGSDKDGTTPRTVTVTSIG